MGRTPFRIAKLSIRSFRGIDALDLEFPADEGVPGGLAVLAGDNGCGKTAVLEAILLVLGRMDLLPPDAAPLEEQVRFGTGDFLIEATVRESDGEIKAVRANKETLRHGMPGLAFREDQDPAWQGWLAIRALEARIEYFSARRDPEALGDTPDPRGPRSEREARRIVELKKRLISTYYRSLRARQRSPLEVPAFERLQSFTRRFLGDEWTLDVLPASNDPGSGDDVVVRSGDLPADITSIAMARAVAPGRNDVPTIVPIDRLSSGQLALFAFAGPLIFRDTPADVILIDEPERHMHIQWQRTMMGALRELSPESQFILATHSLDVLDSALSYERFILVREGDPRARLPLGEAAAE